MIQVHLMMAEKEKFMQKQRMHITKNDCKMQARAF